MPPNGYQVAGVDGCLQSGSRPELRRLGGRDRDLGTRARISANPCRLLDHLKAAEACETDVIALGQMSSLSISSRLLGISGSGLFRFRSDHIEGRPSNLGVQNHVVDKFRLFVGGVRVATKGDDALDRLDVEAVVLDLTAQIFDRVLG